MGGRHRRGDSRRWRRQGRSKRRGEGPEARGTGVRRRSHDTLHHCELGLPLCVKRVNHLPAREREREREVARERDGVRPGAASRPGPGARGPGGPTVSSGVDCCCCWSTCSFLLSRRSSHGAAEVGAVIEASGRLRRPRRPQPVVSGRRVSPSVSRSPTLGRTSLVCVSAPLGLGRRPCCWVASERAS